MSPQKIIEDERNMQIPNCRICLLSKSNCSDCPLRWALDLLDIEKSLKVIEIPLKIESRITEIIIHRDNDKCYSFFNYNG